MTLTSAADDKRLGSLKRLSETRSQLFEREKLLVGGKVLLEPLRRLLLREEPPAVLEVKESPELKAGIGNCQGDPGLPGGALDGLADLLGREIVDVGDTPDSIGSIGSRESSTRLGDQLRKAAGAMLCAYLYPKYSGVPQGVEILAFGHFSIA